MPKIKSFKPLRDFSEVTSNINKRDFPDVIYGTGFVMAHEYLHQLLYFASMLLDSSPYKFSHNNTTPNLNMDAKAIVYPLSSGNEYEVILPAQIEYLNRFFEQLKKL